MNTDLNVASPDELIKVLRDTANIYYSSSEELSSAWQDDRAGFIWRYSAKLLEGVANKIEKKWSEL
jgi:hypothetical protein